MIKILLFILSLYAPLVGEAQISRKVIQSFPAHIISKINEVTSKVKLTEEQQMKFGQQLSKNDNIANITLGKEDSTNNLKNEYITNVNFLKPILSPEQLEDYMSQVDKKNRLLLALKSSKELQLDVKQIEQIRIQNTIGDAIPTTNTKQKMVFYVQKLDSILTKPQYDSLLRIIYAEESSKETREDWNNILELKLATPKDSTKLYPQIYQYHLTKNAVLDNKAGKVNAKKNKELKEKIDLQFEPKILIWQTIASNGIYKNNIFSETIKFQKELNLSTIQIDSLLSNYQKIEQLKFNNKSQDVEAKKAKNYVFIENAEIAKILNPKQLSLLLMKTSETTALKSNPIDKKNRFLLALKSAKELQLDAKQIEQIQFQNYLLGTLQNINPKQEFIFYKRKLDSILKKPQYGSLLKIIYAEESREQTQDDWNNILQLKLATPKDSTMLYAKIYQYHLTKNAILDKKADRDDSKSNKDLKEKIDLKFEPKILIWYAITSNGVYKNNIFSESIKYQKELNLTTIQIDSLLSNYKKIEQLKLNDKSQDLVSKKASTQNAIENIAIAKILDPKQLTLLLVHKNQKAAALNAQDDWKSLDKIGLTKDLDKGTTLKEFTNYHIKYLVADDRVKMDKNKINVFYRRDILLKKPPLLKQLDDIKQSEQKTKNTKNELRW